MNRSTKQNRRRATRYYFASGKQIRWRLDDPGCRSRKGWLSNVSKSGIAFMVDGGRKPEIGDDVVISCGGTAMETYHVVRIVEHERDIVTIAARHDEPATILIKQPIPKLERAA